MRLDSDQTYTLVTVLLVAILSQSSYGQSQFPRGQDSVEGCGKEAVDRKAGTAPDGQSGV